MPAYEVNDEGEAVGSVPFRTVSGERRFTAKPTVAGQVLAYSSITPPVPGPVSLDNTYLANRSRSIEITNFTLAFGTPALTVQGGSLRYAAWAFDAAGDEGVTTQTFQVPRDWSSGVLTFVLHWTNLGAGAGNVSWLINCREVADAGDLNTTAGESTATDVIAAPTQNLQKISIHSLSFTPSAAGAHVRMSVARLGTAVGDTLANDAGMTKVQVTYLADM